MRRIKQAKQGLFLFISIMFFLTCSVGMLSMNIPIVKQESAYKHLSQAVEKKIDRNNIFDSLHLDGLGLARAAFKEGLSGLDFLIAAGDIQNGNILSIVDLSLPSTAKRLF